MSELEYYIKEIQQRDDSGYAEHPVIYSLIRGASWSVEVGLDDENPTDWVVHSWDYSFFAEEYIFSDRDSAAEFAWKEVQRHIWENMPSER